ncbi:MAG: uracil-DNA glycosylase, partial [Gemmatimonadetes bacterium]
MSASGARARTPEPAEADVPVRGGHGHDPAGAREAASALAAVNRAVAACRRCPRLVAWRERVAAEKRAAFRGEDYWGRGVPGFGDPLARILIVGLAPAAHGANRTGRMFTGDRSGDWLFRALHRAGLASQPEGRRADDGLRLIDAYLTAAVRCAPPANRPRPDERDACRPYLEAEFDALRDVRVVVTLGGFAFGVVLGVLRERGLEVPRPRPRFAHGVEVRLAGGPTVLGSYHPSQQNTFTG